MSVKKAARRNKIYTPGRIYQQKQWGHEPSHYVDVVYDTSDGDEADDTGNDIPVSLGKLPVFPLKGTRTRIRGPASMMVMAVRHGFLPLEDYRLWVFGSQPLKEKSGEGRDRRRARLRSPLTWLKGLIAFPFFFFRPPSPLSYV